MTASRRSSLQTAPIPGKLRARRPRARAILRVFRSLSSCDQFVGAFQRAPFNLPPAVLCTTGRRLQAARGSKCAYTLAIVAGAPETGTVAIRRPGVAGGGGGGTNSGRGILSMSTLSHLVVRIHDTPSLNSLAVQDTGKVLFGAVSRRRPRVGASNSPSSVRTRRQARQRRADALSYRRSRRDRAFGALDRLRLLWLARRERANIRRTAYVSRRPTRRRKICPIRCQPNGGNTRQICICLGLVGFVVSPQGLIFVIGQKSSIMCVAGRYHSADDLIATALSVEPTRFVYRGRIAVFSVRVLCDERVVMVAEQKADASEEAAFNWMARVSGVDAAYGRFAL